MFENENFPKFSQKYLQTNGPNENIAQFQNRSYRRRYSELGINSATDISKTTI